MTVTINFENPQVQLGNGTTGIEISPIIIPYSIRDAKNQLQYLGGQVVLTKEDNVAFSDNTTDWYKKALVKIKDMVADAEMYVPEPIVEVPVSSATESPASSSSVVASSSADSATSSEATFASSSVEASASSAEAPASSVAPASSSSAVASSDVEAPASSAESQVTTAPSESTTEA